MSWNVTITDSEGTPAKVYYAELPKGGTYIFGVPPAQKVAARLNITYNYGGYFRIVWEEGIDRLHGKPLTEAIPLLESAVWALGNQRDDNYWKSTQGNAGAALNDLLRLCRDVGEPHLHKLEVD